jgi:cell shape-determining protein MreD
MAKRGLEWSDMTIHFSIGLGSCIILGVLGDMLSTVSGYDFFQYLVWVALVANLFVWFMRERSTQDFRWNFFTWGPRGKSEFLAGALGAIIGSVIVWWLFIA